MERTTERRSSADSLPERSIVPPKTIATPEQVAADLEARERTISNPVPKKIATERATCICGWECVTRDASVETAKQAWTAHMYAQGYRTSDDMELATATHKHEFGYA